MGKFINPKRKRYFMIRNEFDEEDFSFIGDHTGWVFDEYPETKYPDGEVCHTFMSVWPETGLTISMADSLVRKHFMACPMVEDCECYRIKDGSEAIKKCKWVNYVDGYAQCFFNSRCKPQEKLQTLKA